MTDELISRQYVLDKFKAMCDACGEGEKYNGVMCRCCALDDGICIVEDAPTAKAPERTAKVSKGAYDLMRCECGMPVSSNFDYCPKCKARLEWDEDKDS